MYSHYTSVFVLAAQACWALVAARSRARAIVLSHLAAAALYLPWLPFMLEDRDAPNQKVLGKLQPFSLDVVLRHVGRLVDGGPFAPLDDLPGYVALALLGGSVAAGVAFGASRVLRHRPRIARPRRALVMLLAVATPAGAAAYSAVSDDLFVARNLIGSLPMLALALAALLVSLPRRVREVAAAAAFAALVVGAASTFEVDTQRPAYDEVGRTVMAKARPGDVVLELTAFRGPPTRALLVHLEPEVPRFRRAAAALRAATESGGRVLYVRPALERLQALGLPKPLAQWDVAERRTWDGVVPLELMILTPP
jgi:hypothetical protein